MKKKYRFFYPFTGEAPLNISGIYEVRHLVQKKKFDTSAPIFIFIDNSSVKSVTRLRLDD